MTLAPRFDDALAAALAWTREHHAVLGDDVHIVRDIHGRIRIVPGVDSTVAREIVESLHTRLGRFSPGPESVVVDRVYFTPDELAEDRAWLDRGIWLIDRLVSEQGWRRPPVASPKHRPRITFFGLKGGVGRSTALVAAAKRLSEKGKRVLVVDLDLESPGATAMLLQETELPSFGVVDWFVEEAVGQGDDALLEAMVSPSRVGEVLVAPALGSRSVPGDDPLQDGAFVAKLGRAYASVDGADFAIRLERLISGLERVHAPDVVLLDSRAGMHDISAVAVPRLGGTVLLFASGTSQTWLGYKLLFSAWRRDPDVIVRFRDRMRVVAAQVPETGRESYLDRCRLSAYDLFTNFIYESSEVEDAFSHDVSTPDAPHAPLPIYWRREIVEWEPAAVPGSDTDPLEPEQFEAAFGPFLRGLFALPYVADLVRDEREEVAG